MKANISENLILCLEAETSEEAALFRLIEDMNIRWSGSGGANHGGPLPGGRQRYLTIGFAPQENR